MRRDGNRAGLIRSVSGWRSLAWALSTLAVLTALVVPVTAVTDRSLSDNAPTTGGSAVVAEAHTVIVGGVRRTYRSIVADPLTGRCWCFPTGSSGRGTPATAAAGPPDPAVPRTYPS